MRLTEVLQRRRAAPTAPPAVTAIREQQERLNTQLAAARARVDALVDEIEGARRDALTARASRLIAGAEDVGRPRQLAEHVTTLEKSLAEAKADIVALEMEAPKLRRAEQRAMAQAMAEQTADATAEALAATAELIPLVEQVAKLNAVLMAARGRVTGSSHWWPHSAEPLTGAATWLVSAKAFIGGAQ